MLLNDTGNAMDAQHCLKSTTVQNQRKTMKEKTVNVEAL